MPYMDPMGYIYILYYILYDVRVVETNVTVHSIPLSVGIHRCMGCQNPGN